MSAIVCRACNQATPISHIPVSGRCPTCQSPLPLGGEGDTATVRGTANVSMIPPHLRGLMTAPAAPPPPVEPPAAGPPVESVEAPEAMASPPIDEPTEGAESSVEPDTRAAVPSPGTIRLPHQIGTPILPAASFDTPAVPIPRRRGQRSNQSGLVGGVVGCLVVIVGVPLLGLGIYVLAVRPDVFAIPSGPPSRGADPSGTTTMPTSDPNVAPGTEQYADASRGRRQAYNGVVVRVGRVQFGPVVGRDGSNAIIASPDEDYLSIRLVVENRSGSPLPMRSWYGRTFGPAAESQARLVDAAGRAWPTVKLPGMTRLEGQLPEQTIANNRTSDDTIVFRKPEGVRAVAAPLRLSLPGDAVGRRSVYRFEIPASMLGGDSDSPLSEFDLSVPENPGMNDEMMETP